MGITETREQIHNAINTIPPEKLDFVLDFLDDLQRTSADETRLLLNLPGLLNDFQEAREDLRTGKTIPFKAIRRDV